MPRRIPPKVEQNPESWAEFLGVPDYPAPNVPGRDYLELPLWLVEMMVDPKESQEKSKSLEKLALMAEHMEKHGYEPGLVVYGSTSCRLQDGNHRFIICRNRGDKTFKVRLRKSDGNARVKAMKYADIFEDMIAKYEEGG